MKPHTLRCYLAGSAFLSALLMVLLPDLLASAVALCWFLAAFAIFYALDRAGL